MGLFTALTLPDAARLGADHGLEVTAVTPLSAGSVNSNFVLETREGRRFFARVYEEQGASGASAEHQLLRELSASGVPVVVPLRRRDERVPSLHRGKPFAIYPWIEGDIVCQARVTPERCERVGEALARVHLASSRVSAVPDGRFNVVDLLKRLDQIEADSPQYGSVARELRQRLERHAARRNEELPTGVIHGDLFRDNVLWASPGSIAALIDFESASRGIFAFDLMVTLEAWCFSDAFVPELVSSVLSAYHATRPLSLAERVAFECEGALAALRFATTRITDFAMRANPGEAPKRDFRRFVARLDAIEAGVLTEAVAALRG